MVTIVKFNRKAQIQIGTTAAYLENEFSISVAENFVKNVYATIDKIKKHPSRGRESKTSPNIRYVNIDKNRQIYYRVSGSALVIVAIFSNRQNPEKRPF